MKEKPMHGYKSTERHTLCMVFINGVNIRHTDIIKYVTCKKCLAVIKRLKNTVFSVNHLFGE
jgi:hypothetical protein